jgi:hypothetical protein
MWKIQVMAFWVVTLHGVTTQKAKTWVFMAVKTSDASERRRVARTLRDYTVAPKVACDRDKVQ